MNKNEILMDEIKEMIGVELEYFKNQLTDREYLISTKFLGKLKNKQLIDDFKKQVVVTRVCGYNIIHNFTDICKQIKMYDFKNLNHFMTLLQQFELKQGVIDKYGN